MRTGVSALVLTVFYFGAAFSSDLAATDAVSAPEAELPEAAEFPLLSEQGTVLADLKFDDDVRQDSGSVADVSGAERVDEVKESLANTFGFNDAFNSQNDTFVRATEPREGRQLLAADLTSDMEISVAGEKNETDLETAVRGRKRGRRGRRGKKKKKKKKKKKTYNRPKKKAPPKQKSPPQQYKSPPKQKAPPKKKCSTERVRCGSHCKKSKKKEKCKVEFEVPKICERIVNKFTPCFGGKPKMCNEYVDEPSICTKEKKVKVQCPDETYDCLVDKRITTKCEDKECDKYRKRPCKEKPCRKPTRPCKDCKGDAYFYKCKKKKWVRVQVPCPPPPVQDPRPSKVPPPSMSPFPSRSSMPSRSPLPSRSPMASMPPMGESPSPHPSTSRNPRPSESSRPPYSSPSSSPMGGYRSYPGGDTYTPDNFNDPYAGPNDFEPHHPGVSPSPIPMPFPDKGPEVLPIRCFASFFDESECTNVTPACQVMSHSFDETKCTMAGCRQCLKLKKTGSKELQEYCDFFKKRYCFIHHIRTVLGDNEELDMKEQLQAGMAKLGRFQVGQAERWGKRCFKDVEKVVPSLCKRKLPPNQMCVSGCRVRKCKPKYCKYRLPGKCTRRIGCVKTVKVRSKCTRKGKKECDSTVKEQYVCKKKVKVKRPCKRGKGSLFDQFKGHFAKKCRQKIKEKYSCGTKKEKKWTFCVKDRSHCTPKYCYKRVCK